MKRLLYAIAILISFTITAQAQPPALPHNVSGHINVPANSILRAVGDDTYAETTTFEYEGATVYWIDIPSGMSWPYPDDGERLSFLALEVIAGERYVIGWAIGTILWCSGCVDHLDLYVIGGATSTPLPTATSQLRLLIEAPRWEAQGHRGYIRVCACYADECVCANVELEVTPCP